MLANTRDVALLRWAAFFMHTSLLDVCLLCNGRRMSAGDEWTGVLGENHAREGGFDETQQADGFTSVFIDMVDCYLGSTGTFVSKSPPESSGRLNTDTLDEDALRAALLDNGSYHWMGSWAANPLTLGRPWLDARDAAEWTSAIDVRFEKGEVVRNSWAHHLTQDNAQIAWIDLSSSSNLSFQLAPQLHQLWPSLDGFEEEDLVKTLTQRLQKSGQQFARFVTAPLRQVAEDLRSSVAIATQTESRLLAEHIRSGMLHQDRKSLSSAVDAYHVAVTSLRKVHDEDVARKYRHGIEKAEGVVMEASSKLQEGAVEEATLMIRELSAEVHAHITQLKEAIRTHRDDMVTELASTSYDGKRHVLSFPGALCVRTRRCDKHQCTGTLLEQGEKAIEQCMCPVQGELDSRLVRVRYHWTLEAALSELKHLQGASTSNGAAVSNRELALRIAQYDLRLQVVNSSMYVLSKHVPNRHPLRVSRVFGPTAMQHVPQTTLEHYSEIKVHGKPRKVALRQRSSQDSCALLFYEKKGPWHNKHTWNPVSKLYPLQSRWWHASAYLPNQEFMEDAHGFVLNTAQQLGESVGLLGEDEHGKCIAQEHERRLRSMADLAVCTGTLLGNGRLGERERLYSSYAEAAELFISHVGWLGRERVRRCGVETNTTVNLKETLFRLTSPQRQTGNGEKFKWSWKLGKCSPGSYSRTLKEALNREQCLRHCALALQNDVKLRDSQAACCEWKEEFRSKACHVTNGGLSDVNSKPLRSAPTALKLFRENASEASMYFLDYDSVCHWVLVHAGVKVARPESYLDIKSWASLHTWSVAGTEGPKTETGRFLQVNRYRDEHGTLQVKLSMKDVSVFTGSDSQQQWNMTATKPADHGLRQSIMGYSKKRIHLENDGGMEFGPQWHAKLTQRAPAGEDALNDLYLRLRRKISDCKVEKVGIFNFHYGKRLAGAVTYTPGYSSGRSRLVLFSREATSVIMKPTGSKEIDAAQVFGNPAVAADPMAWYDKMQANLASGWAETTIENVVPRGRCLPCRPHKPDLPVENDQVICHKFGRLCNFTQGTTSLGTCHVDRPIPAFAHQDPMGDIPQPIFLKWTDQLVRLYRDLGDFRGLYKARDFFQMLTGGGGETNGRRSNIQKMAKVVMEELTYHKWGPPSRHVLSVSTGSIRAIYPWSRADVKSASNGLLKTAGRAIVGDSVFNYDPDYTNHCFTLESQIHRTIIESPSMLHTNVDLLRLCTSGYAGKGNSNVHPPMLHGKPIRNVTFVTQRDQIVKAIRYYVGSFAHFLPVETETNPVSRHCFPMDRQARELNTCFGGSSLIGSKSCRENPLDPCPEGTACSCNSGISTVRGRMEIAAFTAVAEFSQLPMYQVPLVLSGHSFAEATSLAVNIKLAKLGPEDVAEAFLLKALLQGSQTCGCQRMAIRDVAASENWQGGCFFTPKGGNEPGEIHAANPYWFLPAPGWKLGRQSAARYKAIVAAALEGGTYGAGLGFMIGTAAPVIGQGIGTAVGSIGGGLFFGSKANSDCALIKCSPSDKNEIGFEIGQGFKNCLVSASHAGTEERTQLYEQAITSNVSGNDAWYPAERTQLRDLLLSDQRVPQGIREENLALLRRLPMHKVWVGWLRVMAAELFNQAAGEAKKDWMFYAFSDNPIAKIIGNTAGFVFDDILHYAADTVKLLLTGAQQIVIKPFTPDTLTHTKSMVESWYLRHCIAVACIHQEGFDFYSGAAWESKSRTTTCPKGAYTYAGFGVDPVSEEEASERNFLSNEARATDVLSLMIAAASPSTLSAQDDL